LKFLELGLERGHASFNGIGFHASSIHRHKKNRNNKMPLPDTLDREHILQAMDQIRQARELPEGYQRSYKFLVVQDGMGYPPPAIVAMAVGIACGTVPDPFRAGRGTRCFSLLENAGFEIVEIVFPDRD